MIMGPLTLLAAEMRRSLLLALADAMEADPPEGEDEFADAVKALVTAGLQTSEIARMTNVSTPTVTRWGQGAAKPLPVARKVYARHLAYIARKHAAILAEGIETAGIQTVDARIAA